MDWAALGLTDHVLRWLAAASREHYANEARLDPYATSMRDFDDVTGDLRLIRAGQRPNRARPGQRITDLRTAGLVDPNALALNALGTAVLDAWGRYAVAGTDKDDELARLLLIVLEARRLNDPRYARFERYWADLRTYFEPFDLIEHWDRLYALNYMDYERASFAPGAIVRQEAIAVPRIEFDLLAFARANGGSGAAISGGEKLARAIAGKVPRGRHRASFAMALEIAATDGAAAPALLRRFGVPRRPRLWKAFSAAQKGRIDQILADYALAPAAGPTPAAGAVTAPIPPIARADRQPALPTDIDFSQVLRPVPTPRRSANTEKAGKASGPRKVDHQKKAKADDEVGKLGEEFALRYEQWRLRNHPALLARLRHASLVDDTLGYDIESCEIDGTPRYVEVKGTLGPLDTRFFLSANEMAAAQEKGAAYLILRTAFLDRDPQCCELRYPFAELDMTTAVFSVTFKPQ